MGSKNDQKLLAELQAGSQKALEDLYRSNRNAFLVFCRKYNTDQETALDCYQDAVIALYENVQGGRLHTLSSSLKTYLFSVGKNILFSKLRTNKRFAELAENTVGDEQSAELPSWELTKRQKQLQFYFQRLGPKCQEILHWFYYRKMSINEIKEEGNFKSENVVKSQKSRCLKTLKEAMKSHEGNG